MTLTEIMVSIRDLSFDRYPIPVFILKKLATKAVTNTVADFKVHPLSTPGSPNLTYTYNPNGATDKVDNLTNALIVGGYPIAYTGYFSSQDALNTLLLLSNADLKSHVTFFRRFFLSDSRLEALILEYYYKVLGIDTTVIGFVLATEILTLKTPTVRHLSLWCSIQLVDLRRLTEVSASTFSYNFTDGTGAIAGSNLSQPGQNISVSIGSVFSLTDDNSTTAQYFQEDFNRVGSDNVLGDKESFWFKLFLWLRKKLEGEFGDFTFRDDNVIFGKIMLDRDLNSLTYFDSYPFTYSNFNRGIVS